MNRLRALLAEFGRVYANSAASVLAGARKALAGARKALADETLPAALRQGVARQLEHLRELDTQLAACDRDIAQQAREDPRAQRLARLSRVGVLTASAVAATVADPGRSGTNAPESPVVMGPNVLLCGGPALMVNMPRR